MGARPLAFPSPDWTPQPSQVGRPSFAPLAIVWLCLAFLGAMSGAFRAGIEVQKGSQLGAILALSQELEVLEAAVARSDSTVAALARLGNGASIAVKAPSRPVVQSLGSEKVTLRQPHPTPAALAPPRQVQPAP